MLFMFSTGCGLTNQDIDEMIEEADKDGDGTIEFEGTYVYC